MAVDCIIKNALLRKTLDNVTVVMIAFENFFKLTFGNNSINEENKSYNQNMN